MPIYVANIFVSLQQNSNKSKYGRKCLQYRFQTGGGRNGLKYGSSRKIREVWQPYWSQYWHHCTWLQTLRIREDTVVSSGFQLGVSMPSTTVSFLLLFGFGTNCRLLSLCPLPSRPSSLNWWASRRLRRQFRDIRQECFYLTLQHVFICLWNLDFLFASCTSCTSAMHGISQLWGTCIIGKERKKESSTCWSLTISRRKKATDFKFDRHLLMDKTDMTPNFFQKGAWPGSCDPLILGVNANSSKTVRSYRLQIWYASF